MQRNCDVFQRLSREILIRDFHEKQHIFLLQWIEKQDLDKICLEWKWSICYLVSKCCHSDDTSHQFKLLAIGQQHK